MIIYAYIIYICINMYGLPGCAFKFPDHPFFSLLIIRHLIVRIAGWMFISKLVTYPLLIPPESEYFEACPYFVANIAGARAIILQKTASALSCSNKKRQAVAPCWGSCVGSQPLCFALLKAARPLGISANFTPSDGEQYPGTVATMPGIARSCTVFLGEKLVMSGRFMGYKPRV